MEPVLDNDSSSTGATFTPLFFSQQDSIEYWPSASALKELEEGKQPLSVDLVSPYRLAATPRVDFLSHPQISQDSEGPLSVEESTRTAGEAAERVASVAGGGGGGPLPRESYTFKPQPAQYNQIRPVPPSTGVTHPRREVQWQHSTVDNPPSSVRSSSHISKSHPVRSPSFISNVGVAAHERSSASSWIARGNSFLSEAEIKKAVYEATDQAKQDGQIALALAIDQLYEESLHTRRLADTLHAVLAKHPSPEQQFEFNAYIEQAQKRHKESIRKIQQVEDRVREEANGEVADQSGSEAAGGAPVTLTSPTQLSHAFLADSPFAVQSSTPSITRIVRLANLPVRRRKPVKMASLLDCSDLSSLSSLSPPPQSDPESTQTPDRFTPELSDSITKHQLATDRKSSSLRTSVLGKRPPSKASKNRGHVKRSAKEAGLTPEPEDPIVEAKRRKYREKMNFDDYRVAPSSLRNSLKIVQPVKTINTKIRLHPGTLRLPPPSINGHLSSEQSTPGWSRSRLPTSGLAVPPNDRGRVSQAGTPTLRNTDSKARPQKKARVKMR